MPRAFHILTFGCKVNQYETQALREAWLAAGAVETELPAEADLLCVNSCAVTSLAVSDARRAVRRLLREAPQARIVLTGCAASLLNEPGERSGPALCTLAALPAAPSGRVQVCEPAHKAELLHYFDAHDQSRPASDLPAAGQSLFPPFQVSGFKRTRPVVKVQDGCSQGCAYCIVPLTRGPATSRDPREVLEELRRLLAAGFREIMISGINLRQYAFRDAANARDIPGAKDFWDLLACIDAELAPEWAGRARVRISSVDPAQLDLKGLQTLAASRLVCPHLHLSLQSGCAAVLRRMGRAHYDPEQIHKAVAELRSIWPVFALGADILAGFPGETEAEAAETLELIRTLPLTYAHVFPYSERPGTLAATLPHGVPNDLRRKRAAALRSVVATKRRQFLESLIGSNCSVAMEPEGHGVNELYVPCRPQTPPPQRHGELLQVTVTGTEKNGLIVALVDGEGKTPA